VARKLLRISKVAQLLGGVGENTVRAMVERGELAQPTYSGKTPLWELQDVEDTIAYRKIRDRVKRCQGNSEAPQGSSGVPMRQNDQENEGD
jgi:hypothetical protein